MSDDDEDENLNGLFENGEWKWDDLTGGLVFINNLKPEEVEVSPSGPAICGAIEFREDVDLIEQQRFRKLFARRPMKDDVIILQDFSKTLGNGAKLFINDVKDLALYSAPRALLTPVLINILHLAIADRFMRALLLYCQYFIQISDIMNKRVAELSQKVRTDECLVIEAEYSNNLEDLRLIVAKEYSNLLLGFGGTSKYHHMGPSRKMRSLSKFDAILIETLVRFSIQIVWLALGRRSFNLIELEVHRLFKSSIFNIAEHKLHLDFESSMNETTASVLFGKCVARKSKLNTNSPLNNAFNCNSLNNDYRLLGLGTINFHGLSSRLRFFENALTLHESQFESVNMSMGILGLKRSRFDTMLREVRVGSATSSVTSVKQSSAKVVHAPSKASRNSGTKKSIITQKQYPEILIPEAGATEHVLEDVFPEELRPRIQVNEVQRKRWIRYYLRFRHSMKKKSSSFF